MTYEWRIGALIFALSAGCSSERKLSHVESRIPASLGVRQESAESVLRAQLSRQTEFHARCPAEVRELAVLAAEHVSFPPCPEALTVAYRDSRSLLNLEESTAVEEMIDVQCRGNPRDGFSEAIQRILREPEHKAGLAISNGRDRLRAALGDAQTSAEPLNLWMRNNGEFALPEEQLLFLDRLVNHDGCQMTDQEIDLSYHLLHCLEELVRLQGETEPQRKHLARLLLGVHKVMDRKIEGYFR